nr:regulatory protein RecX [Paeniglutamicibacter terrestris]
MLRQLTASAKSRAQLKTKLLEKEIPEHVAEELLDRFEEIALVDDEAFAEGWVRSRARSRGLARSAIRRELRDKGIEGEMAETALEQIDEDAEEITARDLVERKLRAPSMGLDREKSVRRLVGMLARKGYSPGLAFRIVNAAWEERFNGDDD